MRNKALLKQLKQKNGKKSSVKLKTRIRIFFEEYPVITAVVTILLFVFAILVGKYCFTPWNSLVWVIGVFIIFSIVSSYDDKRIRKNIDTNNKYQEITGGIEVGDYVVVNCERTYKKINGLKVNKENEFPVGTLMVVKKAFGYDESNHKPFVLCQMVSLGTFKPVGDCRYYYYEDLKKVGIYKGNILY